MHSYRHSTPLLPHPTPAEKAHTERVGEVTCHGPGQVVAHPIFRLSAPPDPRDLHVYVWNQKAVALEGAAEWDILGDRQEIEGRKSDEGKRNTGWRGAIAWASAGGTPPVSPREDAAPRPPPSP